MSASVMLLLKATALLLLAMGLSLSLRRAPAGARYVVWLATLVALLLVPALSVWSPLPLRVLPSDATGLVGASDPSPSAPAAPAAPGVAAPLPGSAASAPVATSANATRSPLPPLLLAWLGVVVLLLAWLALGAWTARRIVRSARPLTDRSWLDPLYETADRLELEQAPRLVLSGRIEMPFACGMVRPTVVLPASAEQWSDERRRVVLLHELAHIKRRDLVGHTVGRLVCAAYWFHPLVWSAAKQLRAESERACDDLVLASGARASDYANHLLDIVTTMRRRGAPATALPMANRREFEGRMLAILDPGVKRAAPNRAQRLLLTLGLGTMALSIAAVAPVRRAAEPPPPVNQPNPLAPLGASASHTPRRDSSRRESVKPRPPRPPAPEVRVRAPVVRIETMLGTNVLTSQQLFAPRPMSQPQSPSKPDTALLGPILRTDKSDHVRKSAAWVLNGFPAGVPLLLERLRVDPSEGVREMAAWGLAGVTTDEVTAALVGALRQDRSGYVRATAAWALGYAPGRQTAALETAVSDEDPRVRRKALWALGQSGLKQAPAPAVAALKDADADVRVMAAWLLTEITDTTTLPPIHEAFVKETNHLAQVVEFRALLLLGNRTKEVIDRALASDNPELRARAVRTMAGDDLGSWQWPWPWPWPDARPLP